jgi:hypothetical protein
MFISQFFIKKQQAIAMSIKWRLKIWILVKNFTNSKWHLWIKKEAIRGMTFRTVWGNQGPYGLRE